MTFSYVRESLSVAVDLEYYENPKYYDTLHRAQREAAFRPTKIVNSLAALLKNSFSLIAVALLLFSFHWGITLLLLMAGLPTLFVKIYFADSLYKLQQQQTQTERRAWYYNWLVTNEAHAKEIRIFNLGKLFIEQYKILREKLRVEKLSITARKAYGDFFAQIFSILSVFSAYIFIAFNSVQGAITIGDLVMFFQAFQRGQIFLKELLNSIAGLYEDNLFLTYLSDFLSLEQKVIEPAEPISLPDTQPATVSLEHVFFRYPTSNRSALKNISMTIQPGEHVALVGENGSGKTALQTIYS